jgi:hypothetical protein
MKWRLSAAGVGGLLGGAAVGVRQRRGANGWFNVARRFERLFGDVPDVRGVRTRNKSRERSRRAPIGLSIADEPA